MKKAELIDLVSDKAEITKIAAQRAVDAVIEGLTTSLTNGDHVVLVNFGTFTVRVRGAREFRNPSTGEKIKIKATKVVGFKPGKALKEAVKNETIKSES